MTKSFLLSAVAAIALAGSASAATLTLDGGTSGVIPGSGASNEVLQNVFGFAAGQNLIGGYFGSQVLLDVDATVTASFYGFEAGNLNSFEAGGVELFAASGGAAYAADAFTPLATASFAGVAGTLDFSFFTTFGSTTTEVENGSNPDNSGVTDLNFYAWADDSGITSSETIWLFLDDGGAGNDDNHDDFVISLSVGKSGSFPNPVPLPAGGLLLLGGLGGLAALRRRKNKA